MNELQCYSREDPDYQQGFKTILATEPVHDYIASWWPPGHVIGYEHEFVHAVVDFMSAIETGAEISPNFYDGWKEMQVLTAGLESAAQGQEITVVRFKLNDDGWLIRDSVNHVFTPLRAARKPAYG